jgi:Flp pilus assembly protein TadB
MVTQTKKTTNKKTVSAKKTETVKTTKKTVPTKQVKKVEPKIEKVEESKTQPKTSAKKVYEVSRLYMITFISFMVIAYIQIIGIFNLTESVCYCKMINCKFMF